MPYNGSGTFTRVRNWVADAAAAIKIRADYHDSEDDGFAAGLSNAICKDGQTVVTQNIPLNAKRLINVGDPVNPQDAVTKAFIDSGVTGFVKKTGDTMTGALSVKMADVYVNLNKLASGQASALMGSMNDKARWNIQLGGIAAESGANLGSDFSIHRYNDAGVYLGTGMIIYRDTGTAVLPDGRLVVGATSQPAIACYTPGSAMGMWMNDGQAQLNFGVTNHLAQPASTGMYLTGAGSLEALGTVSSASGFYITGQSANYASSATVTDIVLNGNCYMQYGKGSGYLNYVVNGATQWTFNYTGAGSNWVLNHAGAYKPGGGPWIDSSDARIKNVVGDYDSGLDDILALRPVVFTYKGNDTTEPPNSGPLLDESQRSREAVTVPYPNSPHVNAATAGQEFVGFIAQDVETSNADMVAQREGYIDGVKVTDLRDLDQSRLIFKLLNAVKTLNARIEALEGAA